MTIKNLIAGLTIIAKYDDSLAAQHNVLYAGSTDLPLTDDERAEMERLGWLKDNETESWMAFV